MVYIVLEFEIEFVDIDEMLFLDELLVDYVCRMVEEKVWIVWE